MKEIVIQVKCFNLKYTLECGQCFRWKKVEDYYIGIIKDRVIKIKQDQNKLFVSSSNMDELEEIICRYLSLDEDYESIEERIVKVDNNVNNALKNSTGLRFLKQDFFETIISYIISANNNIPRIQKSVNEISKRYGTKVVFEEEEFYLFPTAEQLKDVTELEYRECGVGFRDKYIYNFVSLVNEKKIDLDTLYNSETDVLRNGLLSIKGVGPKVADCILLFSCSRKEVFPIDTWVEKVMVKLYFDGKEASKKEIYNYATSNFGKDAGIIQQHLFYNIREGLI